MPFLAPSSAQDSASSWLDAQHAYGALGDGAHDDTSALQAWINAAVSTGKPGWLPPGTYKITAPLLIDGACTLVGAGVSELWGPFNTVNADNFPTIAPYLEGAVLRQDTAATDAIQITVAGRSVRLADFGITFGSSILYANTGHGINVVPPTNTGTLINAQPDVGPTSSVWRSITVYGHDGNHYGFCITNPLCCSFYDLRSYAGGGIHLQMTGTNSNQYVGNCVFVHPYVNLFLAGTSHGIELSAQIGGNPGRLLLLSFIRPQAWCLAPDPALAGTSPPAAPQTTFHCDQRVSMVSLVSPDFEATAGGTLVLPDDVVYIDGRWAGGGSGAVMYARQIGKDQLTLLNNYQPSGGDGGRGYIGATNSLVFVGDAAGGQPGYVQVSHGTGERCGFALGSSYDGLYRKQGGQTDVLSETTLVLHGNNGGLAPVDLGASPAAAGVLMQGYAAGSIGALIKAAAGQTADPLQVQDSAGHAQLGVANAGTGGAPKWALRARAVANAESMCQAHTAGSNTGKAIQVIDDSGATIGWLNLTT